MANTLKGYSPQLILGPEPLASVAFRSRSMTFEDSWQCPAVIRDEGVSSACLPKLSFLQRVLQTAAGFWVVFEPIQQARDGESIVSFGCTAFVHRRWAERAKELARQNRVREAMDQLESQDDALLPETAVGACNAGEGLTAVLFGARADHRLSADQKWEVAQLMSLTLLAAHGGYNFREFLWLVASPELAVHLSNGGGPVLLGRTDGGHPELYGLSREESHRLRGSLFYSLFNFQQPVLLLPQNHRELLWLALQNNSDEQISRIVGVSLTSSRTRVKIG
jgi:hypothetical protein